MSKRYVMFPTFRNPSAEKFENWLNQASEQGFHLAKKKHLSTLCMVLKEEQGVTYQYAIDMQLKHHDQCIRMYESFGYEWIGNVGKVLVFAKKVTDTDTIPAFSQGESIVERKKLFRTATLCRILLILIEIPLLIVTLLMFISNFSQPLLYGFIGVSFIYILTLAASYFAMKGVLKP